MLTLLAIEAELLSTILLIINHWLELW
jgi:hypothetical protein